MLNQHHFMHAQAGIALPLVLLFLFVMTLLGVSALRTTISEDGMSGSSRNRAIAFNAAETTLRYAEQEVATLRDVVRSGNLPSQTGSDVRLFVNDSTNPGWPEDNAEHAGDRCTNGYCIAAQYSEVVPPPALERWEDPDLDVWNNEDRHLSYLDYDASGMDDSGIFEAPKYLVEYLGNLPEVDAAGNIIYQAGCDPDESSYDARSAEWPYCLSDPSVFRITARALAGSPGREAVVVLQSTIRVPE